MVTFDTGGSPEILDKESGFVSSIRDSESLYKIVKVIKNDINKENECVNRSKAFNKNDKLSLYKSLYETIIR